MTENLSNRTKRSGEERREGYCPMHTNNTAKIASHSGQWKILLWGAGIFAAALLTLVGSMHTQLDVMGDIVGGMDKTLSVYIGVHREETKEASRRLTTTEMNVADLDTRVSKLESYATP